jgi:hypothetical protein
MNPTEAKLLNRLFDWLLGFDPSGMGLPSELDALEDAVRLADEANKALGSGLSGEEVLGLWTEAAPKPVRAGRRRKRPEARKP